MNFQQQCIPTSNDQQSMNLRRKDETVIQHFQQDDYQYGINVSFSINQLVNKNHEEPDLYQVRLAWQYKSTKYGKNQLVKSFNS